MRVLRPTTWAGRLDKIMATWKRHSPEQIVRKLMAADRLVSQGKDNAAVCRELGVSEATYHRWRNQLGGLKAEDGQTAQGSGTGERLSQAAVGRGRVGKVGAQGERA